jgi:hypothetical protein
MLSKGRQFLKGMKMSKLKYIIKDHDATTDITDAAVDKAYYSPARIGHVKIHWEGIEGGFDGVVKLWNLDENGKSQIGEDVLVDSANNDADVDSIDFNGVAKEIGATYEANSITGAGAKINVSIMVDKL